MILGMDLYISLECRLRVLDILRSVYILGGSLVEHQHMWLDKNMMVFLLCLGIRSMDHTVMECMDLCMFLEPWVKVLQ